MKKLTKRLLCMLLTVCMVSVMFMIPAQAIPTQTERMQDQIVVHTQTVYPGTDNPSSWADHHYHYSATRRGVPYRRSDYNKENYPYNTFSNSACGLFALTNAVTYLNEKFINPDVLADYAANGYHTQDGGTWVSFYENFIKDHGYEYGISYGGVVEGSGTNYDKVKSGLEKLNASLQRGEVAICWLDTDRINAAHYMAIVDHDSTTNKYLLLDSAPSRERGTFEKGYAWKTVDELDQIRIEGKFRTIKSTSYKILNGKYTLTTYLDMNKALDVNNNSYENGANLQIYHDNGTAAQVFSIEHVGNGWHRIRHVASGKCLDVEGGWRASGINVILWPDGGDNQLWRFIPTKGWYYRIQNRIGTYLDVSGGGTADRTNVWAYQGNGTDAQVWYLWPE